MCSTCVYTQNGYGVHNIGPLVKNKRIYQQGYGIHHSNSSIVLPRYYTYRSFQRGRGFGSIFLKFFKTLSPMVFKGLKAIGKEAVAAGKEIINDEGDQPLSAKIRKRSKKAVRNLTKTALQKLEANMSGDGLRRKAIKRRLPIDPSQSIVVVKRAKTKKIKKSKNKSVTNFKINKDIFD
jgi:hypothetical protein